MSMCGKGLNLQAVMYADVLIWVLPHQFVVGKLSGSISMGKIAPENPPVEEVSVDIRQKIMKPNFQNR